MRKWRMRLIALALVTVSVFAGGLLPGYDPAVAAPCCSSCESGYSSCLAGCGYTSACFDSCDTAWDRCFRWCSFSC